MFVTPLSSNAGISVWTKSAYDKLLFHERRITLTITTCTEISILRIPTLRGFIWSQQITCNQDRFYAAYGIQVKGVPTLHKTAKKDATPADVRSWKDGAILQQRRDRNTNGKLVIKTFVRLNPLNPELNPICYLLALLGAHHFLHVSRIRVKSLTL